MCYTTKESTTSDKLGCRDFWPIADSVHNKAKSVIPPLFNGPEILSSSTDKAIFFAKNFFKNPNLDSKKSNLNNPVISLSMFPSRTNLKLYNISVIPQIVQRS